ncbi:hypothetical protein MPPM_0654 [Methylorubrum populi]|uniref:Flagellar hook-length control protein-like C-terminal domain-containing protein n=1 Tax=Methylorubrum populi TaxID=223967 RepID=A0A160P9G0_9HYPH|nr:flagellar hook-length control protein FliK [Methylorubrum populi]BAU89259.1 hypothetical protein MPPM_0654 [Methylorubrum populi]
MRSLDTLSPMRPKAEAGRAPTGEESRAGGGPDFEAVLDAFENGSESGIEKGTGPSGEAPAEAGEARAEAPPALPSELPAAPVAGAAGTADSALQALMALAGPAAAPAPAAPDASLEAMVQRAAARFGPSPGPAATAPALPITVVQRETHFAPVRFPAGALSTNAGAGPVATGALTSSPAAPSVGTDADGSPAVVRDDARPSPPAPIVPDARATGQVSLDPTETGKSPRGGVHASAAGTGGSPPAQGAPALSAPAAPVSEDRSSAAPPSPDAAATAAQPAPLESGRDTAAASSAPIAAAADTLRSPASRGRAALRSDRSEQAGTAALASSPNDSLADGDLAEPAAPAQAGPTGQIRRDPELVRERPAGIARADTPQERAAAAMPQARAEAEAGTETASAGPSAEAPPTPISPAEPMPHETAAASAPMPGSPLRQIVDAVATQLPAAVSGAQARPSSTPTETGPLKILTLQLHPADLGSVLVRMRLQDGRLEMSLRTSREETAERLRKEGDLLAGLLREAGYEADPVTIQAGGAGPGESGPRGQGFASFAGSQGGQQDRQPGAATPDHSGRRPSPRADEAATPTEEHDHETDSRRRDHGGLYL